MFRILPELFFIRILAASAMYASIVLAKSCSQLWIVKESEQNVMINAW